jgi:hypothetical protein
MNKKACYAILELSENSTESEVKKAYWRLSKKYHPDVNKEPDAHDKFIAINEAYEYLMHLTPVELSHSGEDTYEEYDNSYWEAYRQKMRERAEQKAKMRYQEFLRQEQAYKESGIADLGIMLKVALHIILFPLSIYLIISPLILEFKTSDAFITYAVFSYAVSTISIIYLIYNRKTLFKFNELYYKPSRIYQLFKETHASNDKCWYCNGLTANSKYYSIELLRLKDIKLKHGGFRQHQANYIDESANISIPRSQKAFCIHALVTGIKIVSIITSLLFADFSSIVWRFIFGFAIGVLLSIVVLKLTKTRSTVSYLLTGDLLIRLAIWFGLLLVVSNISFLPFDLKTHDYIYLTVTGMILFDCLIMQINSLLFGNKIFNPLINQYPLVEQKVNTNYKLYEDIPVISFFYPLLKWITG